jgi:hypothetical protein
MIKADYANLNVRVPRPWLRELKILAALQGTTIAALVLPGIERASHGPSEAPPAQGVAEGAAEAIKPAASNVVAPRETSDMTTDEILDDAGLPEVVVG